MPKKGKLMKNPEHPLPKAMSMESLSAQILCLHCMSHCSSSQADLPQFSDIARLLWVSELPSKSQHAAEAYSNQVNYYSVKMHLFHAKI